MSNSRQEKNYRKSLVNYESRWKQKHPEWISEESSTAWKYPYALEGHTGGYSDYWVPVESDILQSTAVPNYEDLYDFEFKQRENPRFSKTLAALDVMSGVVNNIPKKSLHHRRYEYQPDYPSLASVSKSAKVTRKKRKSKRKSSSRQCIVCSSKKNP